MQMIRNLRFEKATPWCVLGVMVAIAVSGMVPPTVVPSDADPTEFSAERAFEHVEAIAAHTRPIGSPGSEMARSYIVHRLEALGLTPDLQTITVRDYFGEGEVPVVNILARIEGTASTGAIVLMGHYDTVPPTTGANDNATAVAAVLETGRALLAGPPLRNDVILLLTDGEEPAPRFGSTAFVEDHPLAADVRLAINLEAVGGSGVSQLIEVAGDEGALIFHLAAAVPRPVVSSVVDDIVELIGGSNTDIAPFRDRGIAGLEFAYLGGSPIYHLPADNIDSVHQGSLQHHGTHALGLAQRFGDLDLAAIDGESQEVFFSLFGRIVIHYPAWLGIVLAVIAGAMLATTLWLDSRRGRLSIRGIAAGAGWLFLVATVAAALVAIVWRTLVTALWDSGGPMGVQAVGWMIVLAAIAIGSTVPFYRRLSRRVGRVEIEWAAVALWWILAMVVSLVMPGAGYLFIWPVLAAVVAAAFQSRQEWIVLAIVSAPAVILTVPVMDTFFQMGLPRPGNVDSQIPEIVLLGGFFISLLVVLLTPHIHMGVGRTKE